MMTGQVAIIVADLGYGDAGKGATIDALAAKYYAHTVVRYNGGAQAGHTVVTPEGQTHTFAQFGSATFIPGVATYLSKYFYFDPLALENEEIHLRTVGVHDACTRLFVDHNALLLTPFTRAANRLRELMRGSERHSSCGMGIGETVYYALLREDGALRVGDTQDPPVLMRKLKLQQETIREEFLSHAPHFIAGNSVTREEWNILNDIKIAEYISVRYVEITKKFTIVGDDFGKSLFQKPGIVLFEGAQGVLLDQTFGFQPYTTWSDTTFAQAENILDDFGFDGKRIRLGVSRAYATRHGTGPFVTQSVELARQLPDTHNKKNDWQGEFRVGWFDAVATRYALSIVGRIDALAITNIDRFFELQEWRIALAYRFAMSEAWGDIKELALAKFASNIHDDGSFSGLLKRQPPDLKYQEELTNFLEEVIPKYRTIPLHPSMRHALMSGDHEIFEAISKALGVKVALVGYGPTRNEKYWKQELF